MRFGVDTSNNRLNTKLNDACRFCKSNRIFKLNYHYFALFSCFLFIDWPSRMLAGSAVRALRISSGKNSLILLSTTNVNDSVRNAHQKHKTVKNQDRLAAVSNNSKLDFDLNQTLNKLKQLSVKINTNLLDVDTLRRLDRSSSEFLASLVRRFIFDLIRREILSSFNNFVVVDIQCLNEIWYFFLAFKFSPRFFWLFKKN